MCGSPTGPAAAGSAYCYTRAGSAAYPHGRVKCYGDGCCYATDRCFADNRADGSAADGDRAGHTHAGAFAYCDSFTV